ncbi:pulmonary surfactant-associated protein D-like [Protopterus annectens]|uniref:pulmonary surfactant-associated protein D-like n=1 Tax=Protopterus annectens TaxID=7888 RepID=UPI001CFB32A5|nr:pulmonary surfactant-associated protein D-like [Protopterus annectens]
MHLLHPFSIFTAAMMLITASCQSPANQPTCIAVQGIPGIPGLPGRDEPKGDSGDAGPPGQGLRGEQGPPGKAGPKGDQGQKGSTGYPGVPGPAGVQGMKGVQGPPGNAGPFGLKGSTGSPGTPCDTTRIIALEKQLAALQQTLTSNQKVLQVLGNSRKVGDKTFFTGGMTSNFANAKLECARAGFRLAAPVTESENKAIEEIVKQSNKVAWLAISDEKIEGRFVYLDGNPIKYSKWNPGEPNDDHRVEDCVEMQTTGRWNDKSCSELRLVICEF